VDFTTWSRKALADDGIWFAMKGKHPDEEIAALPADVKVFHVEPLQVPGLDAERCVIWFWLSGAWSGTLFPRGAKCLFTYCVRQHLCNADAPVTALA
jgi:hypothetical protein